MFRLYSSSWCPPRDANICDVWKMSMRGDDYMRQFAAMNQTKCMKAPTERCCSPTEVVLVESEVAIPGLTEILGHIQQCGHR